MDPKYIATKFPRWYKGVRKDHQTTQQAFEIAVYDTETCYGKVFATGFLSGNSAPQIYHGDRKNHLAWFLHQIHNLPGKGDRTQVVAGHFQQFDLSVLFWDILNPSKARLKRSPKRSRFSLFGVYPKCEVEIFWGKPCFGKVRFGKRTVYLLDTFSFFPMSLAKALKAVGSNLKKLDKPKELGKRIIPLDELRPYLEGDLLGTLDLLKYIIELHTKYKTRLCLSLPMLSGKIFRRYYLNSDFARPSSDLIAGAMLSYHGGKNTFTAKPGWHNDCYDLDIRSAYPEAMRQLPNFENGSWTPYASESGIFNPITHCHGIFRVSGILSSCKWGIIFSHDFKKLDGDIDGIWTTGYELAEAIRSGEFIPTCVRGWFFNSFDSVENPFRKFSEEFYAAKETAKDPAEKIFNKLILNSLYGKFIQRNEDDDTGERIAGSMFDPAIASLITGFVRAKIHRLEHKYHALHTATDGILTKIKPDPADLGESLGQLKQENFGPCLIIRNKLYLHYDMQGKLRKTGLHGFEGSPDELLKLWKSANRMYRIERLVKWSESWHIGLPPGTPMFRNKELKLAVNS